MTSTVRHPADLTPATYRAALSAFRQAPGNLAAVVRATGLSERTARLIWHGPPPATAPWCVPAVNVLANEREAARKQREEQERQRVEAARAERSRLEAERAAARQVEEQTLTILRGGMRNAVISIGRLSEGVDALAARTAAQLTRGTDAAGNPLVIPPSEALKLIQSFTLSASRLTDATIGLIQLERARLGLPGQVVGVTDGAGAALSVDSDEEARELLDLALEAQARAERAAAARVAAAEAAAIAEEKEGLASLPAAGGEGGAESGPGGPSSATGLDQRKPRRQRSQPGDSGVRGNATNGTNASASPPAPGAPLASGRPAPSEAPAEVLDEDGEPAEDDDGGGLP